MGEYVLLEDISFRMTCLMEVYVLWVIMLCGRTCLMGGHVWQVVISSLWHILQEDVSYWRTCIKEGQVLLESMFYWRAYLT